MSPHEPDRDVPLLAPDIESFVRQFEALHAAEAALDASRSLLVGLWYLSKHTPAEALEIVRQRIRAYNIAVGTANTDSSGYHETLTRLYLNAIAAHLRDHRGESLPQALALLLNTPLARSDWPLELYSRERLFSVQARREWVEPDRARGSQNGE